MIIFKNEGLIPLVAIKTMGLNVKDNNNAIGRFGTGIKYGLAVLLRNGCSVVLYRGSKKHVFAVKKKRVRGKSFDFVTMDGEELAFTTELGKDWEPWQAFREFWCNTKDERGTIERERDLPKREAGTTMFVITGDAIEEAFEDRWNTVLIGEPNHKFDNVEIQNRKSNHVYYRGIRAMDAPNDPTLFTYNLLSEQHLTEDRTIKYGSWATQEIARTVLGSEDKNFLREFLTAPEGTMEHKMSLDIHGVVPSETLLDVLFDNKKDLSPAAKNLFNSKRVSSHGTTTERVRIGLTEVQKSIVREAKELCNKAGIPVASEIVFVSSVGGTTDMENSDGKFVYKIDILAQGVRYLAVSLLRETLRLNSGRGSVEHQLAGLVLGVEPIIKTQEQVSREVIGVDESDDEIPF